MFKKRYLFLIIFVCLFVISTVSAEEISNETISYDSSLMTDNVSEYDLSISSSDKEIQRSADNGTFTDLQKKINNADVGSTITLENDYKYTSEFPTEGISINKTLTIDGNGHIIDALGQSRIFFINSTKVTLNNILFKNGNATDNGGSIYWYGDDGTVNNCNFTNNIAILRAGAIYWEGTNGTINNSNFINNTARKYSGGAIQWDYNSTNGTVNNCNFINNTGTQRGGAIFWYEVNGRMTNCNFTNNTSINGGAIYWDNNALNGAVDNSSFINNTGDDGGAIYWYGAHGRMTNCNFTNNRGTNGGAINWQRTYGLVNNCNFINNIATDGGAIYWEGTNGTENNCNFTNNAAESNGGAIYWFGANGTISNSNFINNNATTNGGAIYFNDEGSLNNCALVNNIAPIGSEIYIYSVNPNLNYNWWGSNNPNWANLINGSYVLSVYAILNVTAEPSEIFSIEKSNITTKFVWNGTNTDATNLLPKRNVKLSSNGTLTETKGDVGLISEFSASTEGSYFVNAAVDDETLGVNVNVNGSAPTPIPTNITVNPTSLNLTVGETGVINATLNPPEAGNLVFNSSDDKVATIELDESGSLVVRAVAKGNAIITVSFQGNEKYAPASTTVKITVMPKSNIIIVADNVTKYYDGSERFIVKIYESIEFNPIANKSVEITINGKTYTKITDENGTTSIALRLNSGAYDVTTTVDNNTVKSVVTILTTVNGTDVVKMYRNGTQYYATFLDSEGNLLADGTAVRFNINGVLYDRKVSGGKGQAKLNINLEQGEYIITAMNNVTGENAANNIIVLSLLTENKDLTKYYRNASQYTVKMLGEDGNPVGAGKTVKFNVNGVIYERTTNESSIAKLNINLQPGDYIITAEYNDCRVSNNITVLPVLTAKNLTKKYGTKDQFVATLVDGQGKAYENQTVMFNVNGVFYNRITDSTGQAKLNINLMPGEYIITSSYNGTNVANKITVKS
ncbi:Ig-like domain-containing protein [Methanobrevibacter sp.]|uniref:Ig-like domain-containing protein n=1 Tax=Methanobrevibacter sp. TaxID=66852 RepID=UPI003890EA68